jgi:hypothetical protein
MKDRIDERLPVKRLSRRLLGFALLSGLFALGQQESAFAQAGSTGGIIGKQDKSISGGEDRSAPPAQRSKRSARTRDDDSTSGQTAASLRGYWRIQVNCGSHQNVLERGGKWSFDIKAISGNTFAGGFDQGGKIVEGKIEGKAVSLTTQDIFSRHWTGTVLGSPGAGMRMQGSVTGPPDGCTFTASKR